MDLRPLLVPGPIRIAVFVFLALTLPLFAVDVESACATGATLAPGTLRLLTTVPCEDEVPPRISLAETWSVEWLATSDLEWFPGVIYLPLVAAAVTVAGWALLIHPTIHALVLPRPDKPHWTFFVMGLLGCVAIWTHRYNAQRGGMVNLERTEAFVYNSVEVVSVLVLPFSLLRAFVFGPAIVLLQNRFALATGTLSLVLPAGDFRTQDATPLVPQLLHSVLLAVAFWYLAATLAAATRPILAARRRRHRAERTA